jgi:hypothetical protein
MGEHNSQSEKQSALIRALTMHPAASTALWISPTCPHDEARAPACSMMPKIIAVEDAAKNAPAGTK